LRIFKVLLYTAALIALAVLAFPISTADAKTEVLVFKIDPELSKPKVVLGPPVPLAKPLAKPRSVQKTTKLNTSKPTKGFNPCNCVSYVQFKTGGRAATNIGSARNHPVTPGAVCTIGAIIVTYESNLGHVGMVVGCNDGIVTIDDYNYKRCGHTIRPLAISSELIKGYYIL
jgi:hypothetical protein